MSVREQAEPQLTEKTKEETNGEPNPVMPMPTTGSINSTPQVNMPHTDPGHPVAPPRPGEKGCPGAQQQQKLLGAQPPTPT